MTPRSEELLTVLDAGSSRIRVLVAELHEGALRYRAHSVVNSAGMRKGLISDLQPASRALNQAATEADQMAKAGIAHCVVGLGGPHVTGGMGGNRPEVNPHISTCSASAAQSVVTWANKAGLEVTDTVFEAIAAAEATVSADERETGACLLDIGASSTELVVFFEGAVAHTAVVPLGGDH